jgi:hypothetical protein
MTMDWTETLKPAAFDAPRILLAGPVDYDMYGRFREQFAKAPATGLVVIELCTLGGDPEVADDGRGCPLSQRVVGRAPVRLLGKAAIYSAGATFMSFFARQNRYLTRGTRLMIHERKLCKTLEINGPLTSCIASVKAALHEIEHSISIQNEGFENLIAGSQVSMDEVLRRAPEDWYLEAQEAKSLGLIQSVI